MRKAKRRSDRVVRMLPGAGAPDARNGCDVAYYRTRLPVTKRITLSTR